MFTGGVEKVFFKSKEHKEDAKYAKGKHINSDLYDLRVNTLRPLRFMYFDFFNTPKV